MRWMRGPGPVPWWPTQATEPDRAAGAPPVHVVDENVGPGAPRLAISLFPVEGAEGDESVSAPPLAVPPSIEDPPPLSGRITATGALMIAVAAHALLLASLLVHRHATTATSDPEAIPVEVVIDAPAESGPPAAQSAPEAAPAADMPDATSGSPEEAAAPADADHARPSATEDAAPKPAPEASGNSAPATTERPDDAHPDESRAEPEPQPGTALPTGEPPPQERPALAASAPRPPTERPRSGPRLEPGRSQARRTSSRAASLRPAPKVSRPDAGPAPIRRPEPAPHEARRMPENRSREPDQSSARPNRGAGAGSNAHVAARRGDAERSADTSARGQGPRAPASTGVDANAYRSSVYKRVQAARRYPESARSAGTEGSALLRFTIDAAGRVVSASIVASSGKPDLDAEALASVRRAAPFPAPPPGVDRTFPVRMTFRLGDW